MRDLTKLVFLIGVFGVFGSGLTACANAETPAEAEANAAPDVSTTEKMTPERMAELVKSFDPDSEVRNNVIAFKIQEREVIIVHDAKSDRMRALSPIARVAILDDAVMMRMLQANYDSVLDARYAVADGLVWSVFIHPLGSLQQEDLLSAIAQVVTSAETFGTTFASGAMVFGGGDSNELHNELLKKLEEAAKKKDAI